MMSVTVVAGLPAAIVLGEKVSVERNITSVQLSLFSGGYGRSGIDSHKLPHTLAAAHIAEIVAAFGVVFLNAVYQGVERFQFVVPGLNRIQERMGSIRQTDSDINAPFMRYLPCG